MRSLQCSERGLRDPVPGARSRWTSNLLGLQVSLSQIVLDITAVPGPGNLLGNLLCAVAGLLDGSNASGNAITNLLNRLLGLLG